MNTLNNKHPKQASVEKLKLIIADLLEEEVASQVAVGSFSSRRTPRPLVLNEPVSVVETPQAETEEENAFADLGMDKPANSSEKPEITNSKMLDMAQSAIEVKLDEIAPEQIQSLIESIAPVRMANIFAENGQALVQKTLDTHAPSKIENMVAEIAPVILENSVSEAVDERLADRLSYEMKNGLEPLIAEIIREEMQGAFGYNVTRKIRQLIHAELKRAFNQNL